MKLERIFRYRTVWMGVAILWIIWFHSALVLPGELCVFLKEIGYGGVDIFIFASGIGCYYSLARDRDSLRFLKRRFLRIIPTYWCFIVIWLLYRILRKEMLLSAIVGNLLCVQNLTGQGMEFNWYMSAIVLLYLFSPIMAEVVEQLKSWKQCMIVLLIFGMCSIPFWGSFHLIIMVTRLPVFFLGMYVAKRGKQGDILSAKMLLGVLAVMLAGFVILAFLRSHYTNYLWSYGLEWYPFLLIAPGMCIGISYLMEKGNNNPVKKLVEHILTIAGKYSFELYLVQTMVFEVYVDLMIDSIITQRIRYKIAAVLCIGIGCFIFVCYKKLVMKAVSCIMERGSYKY